MKNNKITFSQFLTICFLSSLSSVLFITSTPSVYVLISSALALLVNYFVFLLYKGQNKKILFPFSAVFVTVISAVIVVKFADYMNKALSYGPACLIIAVMLAFTFFCTVKGVEAVARASTVIAVFVIAGLIYMLVCTFTNIKFNISLQLPGELNSSALLLLPSVLYILCYDDIIEYKPKYCAVYSAVTEAVILYFLVISNGIKSSYPIQRLPAVSEIGVFKGADCILLSILTISCVFIVTTAASGIFKTFKHNYITNALYIGGLIIFSVVISYFGFLNFIEKSAFVPFIICSMILLIILCTAGKKNMYKNS